MAGDGPPKCSACGANLGNPDDEVAHPDDEDASEDAHFVVQVRDDGEQRAQCTETGQLASVIHQDKKINPIKMEVTGTVGEGGRDGREQQERQGRQSQSNEVYDIPEDKDQIDILSDVVTNPHYELNDEQIDEVKRWAEDYNGQMPPDVLERLLENMQGIQKQTAKLVRERYELKLNKWIREQSQNEGGPPIGAVSPHVSPQSSSRSGRRGGTPTPAKPQNNQNQKQQEKSSDEREKRHERPTGESTRNLRRYRKERRVERRHDAADIAIEEVAQQAAPEVARELTKNFGRYFGLPGKILEAKIEKDPDWAIEKMEQTDIDIFELLEPSEQRKKEKQQQQQQTQPQVDDEIDDALDQIRGGDQQQSEPVRESNKSQPPESESTPQDGQGANSMDDLKQANDEIEQPTEATTEDGDSFNEIFGEQ